MSETGAPINKENATSRILFEWKADMDEDSGARAELRRCETERDVMLCRGFAPLLSNILAYEKAMGNNFPRKYIIEHVARTAFVLARFRALDRGISPAFAMSVSVSGKPVVSVLRASLLFRSDTEQEAARVLASMATLIGPCDAMEVHRAMRNWDRVRRDWAVQYNLRVHDLSGLSKSKSA